MRTGSSCSIQRCFRRRKHRAKNSGCLAICKQRQPAKFLKSAQRSEFELKIELQCRGFNGPAARVGEVAMMNQRC
eukprot:4628604-Pleurochrysis_carterae.AAC.2